MSGYEPLGLEDKMPFGKFKGLLIKEIINKHPYYYKWLKENTSVKFTFKKKKKDKPGLATIVPKGRYEGITVAEVIRNDVQYAIDNFADELDRQAQYYLSKPEFVLKALYEINYNPSRPLTEEELVEDSTYQMKGLRYMASLRVKTPIFD